MQWLVSLISGIASGVYFPPEIFQGTFLYLVAFSLPQTHTLKAVRLAILSGQGLAQLSHHILVLGVYAPVLLTAGILSFRYALKLSRRKPLTE